MACRRGHIDVRLVLMLVFSDIAFKGVLSMDGLQGSYSMEEASWIGISLEAKELIRRLLSVDPVARPTASEVQFLNSLLFLSGDFLLSNLHHS